MNSDSSRQNVQPVGGSATVNADDTRMTPTNKTKTTKFAYVNDTLTHSTSIERQKKSCTSMLDVR